MVISRFRKKRKIGLALGSGAARGFANIGVIKALKEMGISADMIAGTSMGAVVGAFEATGSLETMEEAFDAMDWKQIMAFITDIAFPRYGIIDGKRLSRLLSKYIRDTRVEDTAIPIALVSTDVQTGEEVVIEEGPLMEAVRASISIPGIFTPVRRGNRILVDGALVNPVPINTVQEMGADVVIAVDMNQFIFHKTGKKLEKPEKNRVKKEKKLNVKLPGGKNLNLNRIVSRLSRGRWPGEGLEKDPTIFEILLNSWNIMSYHIASHHIELYKPDVVVKPHVEQIRLMEFHRMKEAVQAGYRATYHQREEIEEAVQSRRKKRKG